MGVGVRDVRWRFPTALWTLGPLRRLDRPQLLAQADDLRPRHGSRPERLQRRHSGIDVRPHFHLRTKARDLAMLTDADLAARPRDGVKTRGFLESLVCRLVARARPHLLEADAI